MEEQDNSFEELGEILLTTINSIQSLLHNTFNQKMKATNQPYLCRFIDSNVNYLWITMANTEHLNKVYSPKVVGSSKALVCTIDDDIIELDDELVHYIDTITDMRKIYLKLFK